MQFTNTPGDPRTKRQRVRHQVIPASTQTFGYYSDKPQLASTQYQTWHRTTISCDITLSSSHPEFGPSKIKHIECWKNRFPGLVEERNQRWITRHELRITLRVDLMKVSVRYYAYYLVHYVLNFTCIFKARDVDWRWSKSWPTFMTYANDRLTHLESKPTLYPDPA